MEKKADELLNTLEEDFTDVPAKDAFCIATESEKIVGVYRFDADLERREAKIWGPFVDHADALRIAHMLWESLMASHR